MKKSVKLYVGCGESAKCYISFSPHFSLKPFHSWGWSGGAMVLGKLPVPGRPTNLDHSRARAYCACSGYRWEFVWIFSLSSIGRRSDID